MSAVEGRAEVVGGAANRCNWPAAEFGSHFETGIRLEWSRDMPAQAKLLDVRWKLVGHLAYT